VLKIMIVDDSDTLRGQLLKLLQSNGFEVVEANNGAKGVEVFGAIGGAVNLIITDYNMPELDGLGMIRKIRALPKGDAVPVFMLTTESSPELKNAGKEIGVRAWVTKPFSDEKLIMAIKKVAGT